MRDYSKAKIYSLFSKSNPHIGYYIGSTTQPLNRRLSEHKYDAKHNINISSSKIAKYSDVEIKLLLDYPCRNKKELDIKEGEIVKEYQGKGVCVNIKVAGRSKQQYRKDKDYEIKRKKKEYYEKQKSSILHYQKEYREKNKEKIKQQRREYREKNKEKIKQRKREYWEKNKDKINEKRRKPIVS